MTTRTAVILALRLAGLAMVLWSIGGMVSALVGIAALFAGAYLDGLGSTTLGVLLAQSGSFAWFFLGLYLLLRGRLVHRLLFRGLSPDVCSRCGYDLAGLPSGKCPECGTRFISPDRSAA